MVKVHSSKTPVLIVEAGPVGLALAGDLGWRGIPCVLIERGDGLLDQPKMDMAGIRTMEFCRRWGIAPWVESAKYNRLITRPCVKIRRIITPLRTTPWA